MNRAKLEKTFREFTCEDFTNRIAALNDSRALVATLREARKYYGVEFANMLIDIFDLKTRFGFKPSSFHKPNLGAPEHGTG